MLKRSILAWFILCSCLALVCVSLLQVKRAAYPPSVRILRSWKVPGDSMLNLSNVQDVYIDILDTIFEDPLINYTEILVSGSDSLSVKTAWFARSIPPDVPYIVFHTAIETTEDDATVYYEFLMPHPKDMTMSSTMVLYVHTNTNSTYIEIHGVDTNGTRISKKVILEDAYQKYFLFIIQLRNYAFQQVDGVRLVCHATPNSNVDDYTVTRILQIVDEAPSIDGIPIDQGQSGVVLSHVQFPHSFAWKGLKPQNLSLLTTCWQNASWSSTITLLNYTWQSRINEMSGLAEAYLDLFFYRLANAPIIQARMAIEHHSNIQLVDILANVTSAFSNQPNEIWPKIAIPLEKNVQGITVNVVFMYWPSPWYEIAIFSLAVMTVELFPMAYMKIKSKFFKTVDSISEA